MVITWVCIRDKVLTWAWASNITTNIGFISSESDLSPKSNDF